MVQKTQFDEPQETTIAELKKQYDTIVGLAITSLTSGTIYLIVESTDEGINMMQLIGDPPERTPGLYTYSNDKQVRVVDREYMRQWGAPFKWNAIAERYPAVNNIPAMFAPPNEPEE